MYSISASDFVLGSSSVDARISNTGGCFWLMGVAVELREVGYKWVSVELVLVELELESM